MSPFWKTWVRFNLVILAFEIIVATVFVLHEGFIVFYHTSFKFVVLFLVIILASNILAKLTILYIET